MGMNGGLRFFYKKNRDWDRRRKEEMVRVKNGVLWGVVGL